MRPIGMRTTVGNQVHPDDALGVLYHLENLSRRNAETFGNQLEVVNQFFHRGTHDLRDVLGVLALAVGTDG